MSRINQVPHYKGDELLHDPCAYQRLVRKLIYLIIIQPDILIAVSVMAQFMRASRTKHLVAVHVHKILR